MRRFTLPGSELQISELTLGTDYYGKTVPEERAFRLLDLYTAAGGNTVDTAHVYADYLPGEKHSSEKVIGRWLKARKCRGNTVISTKGGFPELTDYHRSRLSPDEIRSDLEGSLRCLDTDYVDVYWLHRDDPDRETGEFVRLLNGFRKEGLIREYGFSNFSPRRIGEALKSAAEEGLAPPVGSQIKWGLAKTAPGREYDDTIEEMNGEHYAFLKETGLALFAYASQAKGFFSKLKTGEDGTLDMEPGKCRDRYFCPENVALYEKLKEEADRKGMRAAVLAMRKMLESPFPVTLLVGSKTEEQLLLSLEAAEN